MKRHLERGVFSCLCAKGGNNMGAKVIFTDYQICGEIMSFNEGRKLVFAEDVSE